MKKEMRKQVKETLVTLMKHDKKLVVCDADLASSSGFAALFQKYPKQSINFGISEANMAAASGGMSQTGLKPVIHSFCPFVTRRIMDQLFVSVGFAQNHLFVYASDPGYWSQYNGATHTSFEDIAIMRSIPNLTVFAPSDARCVDWMLQYYAKHPSFIYARIPRKEVPVLYKEDEPFTYGKGKILKQGNELAIFCCGPEISDALEVAEILEQERHVSVTVVDLLFIKPMDTALVLSIAQSHKAIVTIENHSQYGGIGEAIGTMIAEMKECEKPLFHMIAVKDRYGEVGSVEYLKKTLHIDKSDIYDACNSLMDTYCKR